VEMNVRKIESLDIGARPARHSPEELRTRAAAGLASVITTSSSSPSEKGTGTERWNTYPRRGRRRASAATTISKPRL